MTSNVFGVSATPSNATDRNYIRALECQDKSVPAEKAAKCPLACRYTMTPAPGQTPPHLFTEASFQVQGLVGHEELPGGLSTRLGSWLLRSKLHLTDQQTGRVPGKEQRTTWWHLVLGRGRSSAFPYAQTQESTDKVGQSWTTNQGASLDHPSPLRQSWRDISYYLLWILSSTFSVEKAFTSKSTPQVCQRERGQLWNQDQKTGTSADVSVSLCTPEIGRLLPAANYSGLPPLSQTSLTTGVGTSTCSTELLINEA